MKIYQDLIKPFLIGWGILILCSLLIGGIMGIVLGIGVALYYYPAITILFLFLSLFAWLIGSSTPMNK